MEDLPFPPPQPSRNTTATTATTCSEESSFEDEKARSANERQCLNTRTDDIVTFNDKEPKERAPLFRLQSELDVENQVRSPKGPSPTLRYRSQPKIIEYSDESSEGSLEENFRQSLRSRIPTFTTDEMNKIPRLVHRNLPFHQSRQTIAVKNEKALWSVKLQYTLFQDWYHLILRWPTFFSVIGLVSLWTFVIIVFAFLYRSLDALENNCGLGKEGKQIAFNSAFAFSLETCTTVGYGLPNGVNSFFEPECQHIQVAIYFQMVWSMLFNAFLFAFLFARLARCEARGAQVLFSQKAIIEKRDGRWFLHVRVYDMDSAQPVVEAHVRMYCVSWRDYERQTRDFVQPHLLHAMRILQPNDELGANMYTSIPANVTHQIDAYSALAPPGIRKQVNTKNSHGIVYREVDSPGNACPVCGEVYDSLQQLEHHIAYKKIEESVIPNFPIKGSHRDSNLVQDALVKPIELTEQDIFEQLRDKEIMCVVEGIEPMVSGTFQALQSYKLEDIVFGGTFAPCMSQRDGQIYVDISQFHKIEQPSDHSSHNYPIQNAASAIKEDKHNWRESVIRRTDGVTGL